MCWKLSPKINKRGITINALVGKPVFSHILCSDIVIEKLIRLSKIYDAEALVPRCSVEKVFLEFLQNPQENTCPGKTY